MRIAQVLNTRIRVREHQLNKIRNNIGRDRNVRIERSEPKIHVGRDLFAHLIAVRALQFLVVHRINHLIENEGTQKEENEQLDDFAFHGFSVIHIKCNG